jgi:hypothetical protein
MLDLIERLEKATGPDSNLDREIATACGIAWSSDEEGQFGGYDIMPRRVRFTASIDAALLLVPKDSGILLRGANQSWYAAINSTPLRQSHPKCHGFASSPERAICIAALKVRAALNIQHREGET